MQLNKASEILKKNLEFPYCSASAYYNFDWQKISDNFWWNCCEQAEKLKKDLEKFWIEAKYIDDFTVGRHRSIIMKWDDWDYYLSPYLMQEKAILLTENIQEDILVHPFIWDKSWILKISKKDNILNVTKLWPNSYRKDIFSYDINKLINDDLSLENHISRVIHPEQTTLSIRVIDFENTDVLHYIFDFKSNKIYTLSSKGRFYIGTKEFDETLKKIANIIDSSPSEIQDFIHWAYKIREKILKHFDIKNISL